MENIAPTLLPHNIVAAPPAKINHNIVHEVVILMTSAEQDALKHIIADAPDDAVFVEYGCGGSTCLFALHMRASQRLYSIEHNKEWFLRIRHVLSDLKVSGDVMLHWKPACEGKPLVYKNGDVVQPITEADLRPYGHPAEELALGLEDYIHARGTDIDWSKVRCVLVDGVARGAVLAILRLKLSPGTIVLLHDATERTEWYKWAVHDVYTIHGMVDHMLVLEVPPEK